LLKLQKNQGVDRVILTPHFYAAYSSINRFILDCKSAFNSLALTIEENQDADNIPEIVIGAEVLYDPLVVSFEDISKLAIAGTDYILIELPYAKQFEHSIIDSLDRMMCNYNLIPIIAHIERYPYIGKNLSIISELMEIGCKIQVNADAIINPQTRNYIWTLMDKWSVDFIASDCHNLVDRKPNVMDAIKIVSEQYSREYVSYLDKVAMNTFG
jgi:protein-tyrosine phosphatase